MKKLLGYVHKKIKNFIEMSKNSFFKIIDLNFFITLFFILLAFSCYIYLFINNIVFLCSDDWDPNWDPDEPLPKEKTIFDRDEEFAKAGKVYYKPVDPHYKPNRIDIELFTINPSPPILEYEKPRPLYRGIVEFYFPGVKFPIDQDYDYEQYCEECIKANEYYKNSKIYEWYLWLFFPKSADQFIKQNLDSVGMLEFYKSLNGNKMYISRFVDDDAFDDINKTGIVVYNYEEPRLIKVYKKKFSVYYGGDIMLVKDIRLCASGKKTHIRYYCNDEEISFKQYVLVNKNSPNYNGWYYEALKR